MSTKQRSDPPAFTPLWEQRLIAAAKRGDHVAESQMLDLYEPMVRRITGSLYLPGGEREDLAQEARLGILAAIRAWDPGRCVPFRCFAWLCAVREARMAVSAARAARAGRSTVHAPWTLRSPRTACRCRTGSSPPGTPTTIPWPRRSAASGCEPCSMAHVRSLSSSAGHALSANDCRHRDSARVLGVGERAVNNALQRARRKLAGPVIPSTATASRVARHAARP
jgi:RNA polymerase sporulation-specific sigma factor